MTCRPGVQNSHPLRRNFEGLGSFLRCSGLPEQVVRHLGHSQSNLPNLPATLSPTSPQTEQQPTSRAMVGVQFDNDNSSVTMAQPGFLVVATGESSRRSSTNRFHFWHCKPRQTVLWLNMDAEDPPLEICNKPKKGVNAPTLCYARTHATQWWP